MTKYNLLIKKTTPQQDSTIPGTSTSFLYIERKAVSDALLLFERASI